MFVHHVFFWLNSPGHPDDRAQLLAGLQKLRALPPIRTSHLGLPADTHRDVVERTYAVSWLLTFDTAEDEAAYQVHPAHQQFVADCQHLWSRVVVYDTVSVE